MRCFNMAAPEQGSPVFDIGSVSTSGYQLTSTTVLRDGWIVVTWLDQPYSQIKYSVLDADGTAFGSSIVVNNADERPADQQNVAATWDGRFLIAYGDKDADADNHALLMREYDVFTGLAKASVIDNANNAFGAVISPFTDGSYNITYNNYVDGIRYYHHASPSGSDTSYYGEADGNYRLETFGAGAVSVDQASYANLYKLWDDEPGEDIYLNIRKKNGDSVAKRFIAKVYEPTYLGRVDGLG
jgi:hypothetical protein